MLDDLAENILNMLYSFLKIRHGEKRIYTFIW
jgi:hypothetical protein